jgi:mannosyltransferase
MLVVGAFGITRPGLWGDEFATWGSVALPWSRAVDLLDHYDAVMAPYYAFLHGWTRVFGLSDLSLRFPSLLAMAGAASLVGATGARLSGPRVGLIGGVVFALLPGVSRYAQEARVYALAVFAATLATYLLVRAVREPVWWRLAWYGAGVALLGLTHGVALLLLLAHGAVVLGWHRRLLSAWLGATGAGILAALPVLWAGFGQRDQIAWIARVHFEVWLYLEIGLGLAWALIALLALAGRPLRPPAAWYLLWAVAPLAGMALTSLVMPLWVPRYLMFMLPAWALLAAAGLARLRPVWMIVGVALIAVLGSWMHVYVRSPSGHEGADTQALARIINDGYQAGDAVAFGADDGRAGCCTWVPRDTLAHYIPGHRRPADVFAVRPQRMDGRLAAVECADPAACLGAPPRLWVVRLGERADPLAGLGAGKEGLVRQRFQVERVWHPTGFTVALLTAR